MRIWIIGGAISVGALFMSAVGPEGTSSGNDENRRASGRIAVIADSCAACHGTGGRLVTAIPRIAGRPEPILRERLLAFKNDEVAGSTVMPRLAKGYSEETLRALARHFALLSDD